VLPKINQTIYMQVVSDNTDAAAINLRSRVADMDDSNIYIEIPLDEKSRRYYKPDPGEPFQFYFFTKEGVQLLFDSKVTGFRKEAVNLVSIRRPGLEEITKNQRRSFLRVEANLELAVKVGEKLRFVAVTEDVGGGGVSFICERKWPIVTDAVLHCWLLLRYRNGSISHANFEGEVVRVMAIEPERHLVMMRFKEISDSDQQKIIRYCFERQLEMRRD